MRDPKVIDEAITALTARVVEVEVGVRLLDEDRRSMLTMRDRDVSNIGDIQTGMALRICAIEERLVAGGWSPPAPRGEAALAETERRLAGDPPMLDFDPPPGISVGTVVLFHPGIGKGWCEATVTGVEPDGTLLLSEGGIPWKRGPLQVAVRP